MTDNKPLLTLRYRWYKLLWRFFWMGLIGVPLFYVLAFEWAPKATGSKFWVGEIIGVSGFIGGILVLLRVLLCKGVVFFSDRVVMSWHVFGEKELYFKDARLTGSNIIYPMLYRVKTLTSRKYTGYLKGIKGILIEENLLSGNDRKRLNEFLMKISGSSVEELKKRTITIEKLMPYNMKINRIIK
jgi:hypothetical protein